MATIGQWHKKSVAVVTNDGRLIVGLLRGHDDFLNLVLQNAFERVVSPDSGIEQIQLGLYVLKGDNIAVIGELDDQLEEKIEFSKIRGQPLKPIVH